MGYKLAVFEHFEGTLELKLASLPLDLQDERQAPPISAPGSSRRYHNISHISSDKSFEVQFLREKHIID